MWSGLSQLPAITQAATGDSWNLNRRRHFITPRQVRPQAGATTQQLSFRSIAPCDMSTQLALQAASPDHMMSEDAALIREVYETHANRFFEDLRGDMMKQSAALVEQSKLTKKPPIPPELAPSEATNLQNQLNSLWQQVQEMQKTVQEMQRAPAKGVDHDAVRALCTEVVHRVLAERGPLLNEQHLRPFEAKIAKLEQKLETNITCEIQELRVTSSRLVKRVNHVAATSGQLDERLQGLEKERQRVGTARADEWMSIARRQLEDFGNNLKSAKSKAADPAAEELLTAMARARAALESGQKARETFESFEQAATNSMGLAVMWGKGDMMQMHACLQEEDVRSSKPMVLPTEVDSLPILIEETASPSPQHMQGLPTQAAHDLDCPDLVENVDLIKAKACMALEGLLLGDDWQPEEDLHFEGACLHPKPPNGYSPEKVSEIKARACMALEGLLLGDDWQPEEESETEKLAFLVEQKARARAALESFLLGDDLADFEDDDMEFIEDTKARARAAVESALLGDLGDFSADDQDDGTEALQDVEAIKQKAQDAIESYLLGDW